MEQTTIQVIENKYELHTDKLIGQGQFGKVYTGWDIENQKTVAIKILKVSKQDYETYKEIIEREIPALYKLQSVMQEEGIDNIISLYNFYQTQDEIILVMEYCPNGNLEDVQTKKQQGVFSEQEAKDIFQQLIDGLYLLHKTNIVHRDIKQQNILKSADSWKIADFGFANFGNYFSSFKGSIIYMAPQILKGCWSPFKVDEYSQKCDIFSLGVLFHKMIFNTFPFSGKTPQELYQNIQTQQLAFPNNIKISNQLKGILAKMLQKTEHERYSIFELKNHPYFKTFQDLETSIQIESSISINKNRNLLQKSKNFNQAKFKPDASISMQSNIQNQSKLQLYNQRKKEFQKIRNKINLEQSKINYLLQIYFNTIVRLGKTIGLEYLPIFYFKLKFSLILVIRERLQVLVSLLEERDTFLFIKPNIQVCSENILQEYFESEEFTAVISQLKVTQQALVNQDRLIASEYNDLLQFYPEDFRSDKYLNGSLNPKNLILDSNINQNDLIINKFFQQQLRGLNKFISKRIDSLQNSHDHLVWIYHALLMNSRLSDTFKDSPENNFEFNINLFFSEIDNYSDEQLYELNKQKLNFLVDG